jgi:hypothetical protein
MMMFFVRLLYSLFGLRDYEIAQVKVGSANLAEQEKTYLKLFRKILNRNYVELRNQVSIVRDFHLYLELNSIDNQTDQLELANV